MSFCMFWKAVYVFDWLKRYWKAILLIRKYKSQFILLSILFTIERNLSQRTSRKFEVQMKDNILLYCWTWAIHKFPFVLMQIVVKITRLHINISTRSEYTLVWIVTLNYFASSKLAEILSRKRERDIERVCVHVRVYERYIRLRRGWEINYWRINAIHHALIDGKSPTLICKKDYSIYHQQDIFLAWKYR